MCTNTVVVLASGDSSRFWPLAQDRHKTLYPIYQGSTIFRMTLGGLLQNGFRKVIITAKPRDVERMRQEVPVDLEVVFVAQERADGQGDALLKAAAHVAEEAFYVIAADKIYANVLIGSLKDQARVVGGCKCSQESVLIATTPTDTPSLYGIVETMEVGCVISKAKSIIEKPMVWPEPHPRRIVSAYRLTKEFIETLAALPSGPQSFEKALDAYAKTCAVWSVPVDNIPETTLKYPWHLLGLNRLLMQNLQQKMRDSFDVEEGATLKGPVHIEKSVYIARSAVVRGPCVIREGARIGDFALVRDSSYIGRNVVIGAHSEVKNSIICDGTKLHNACVLDSIIDEGCNLGAGTHISNSRFDGKAITSFVRGEKISTGLKHFGIVMGKGSRTATLANFMPGVKIGRGCLIGGSFDVTKDLYNFHTEYRDGRGMIRTEFTL
ncbi:MAG: sugar phosphate nucleotidyltransferase [bacterium]|nr:sugar phosphate nucleotidyltransferase [bacterium]